MINKLIIKNNQNKNRNILIIQLVILNLKINVVVKITNIILNKIMNFINK